MFLVYPLSKSKFQHKNYESKAFLFELKNRTPTVYYARLLVFYYIAVLNGPDMCAVENRPPPSSSPPLPPPPPPIKQHLNYGVRSVAVSVSGVASLKTVVNPNAGVELRKMQLKL